MGSKTYDLTLTVPPETSVLVVHDVGGNCAAIEGDQGEPHPDAERRELALAFCRECLGWPDASYQSRQSIFENRPRRESSHISGKMHGFQISPEDLGHVINAVKEWCDIHAAPLSLDYSAGSTEAWRVRIASHAETQGGDPCFALLRACLDAKRGLKSPGAEIDVPPKRRNPAILENPWGDIGRNAPIALAFCKECRGWEKARLVSDWGYVYVSERLADYPVEPREREFHCNENHVDEVIDAVRAWCDLRNVAFTLDYFPSGSATDCWRARVGQHEEAHGDLASAALMAGCVAAHRKIAVCHIMGGLLDRHKK